MNAPSKQEELDLMEQLAEKLGENSYCGPWLKSEIPMIKLSILSDETPACSWSTIMATKRHIDEEAVKLSKRIAELSNREKEIDRKAQELTMTKRDLAYRIRKLSNEMGEFAARHSIV